LPQKAHGTTFENGEGERKGEKEEAEWNSKSNVTNNMNRSKERNSTDYMGKTLVAQIMRTKIYEISTINLLTI